MTIERASNRASCHGAGQQPIELDATWLVDEVAVASLLDPKCRQSPVGWQAFSIDALELAVEHAAHARHDD